MKNHELFEQIKRAGLRLTGPRRAMLEILSDSQKPLSAKDLLLALAQTGRVVNKTTVYREIESLEKIGALRSIQLGERSTYYELETSAHHHHLVCLNCDRVEDVDINERGIVKQEAKIVAERQFQVSYHALEFFGLCRQCQQVGS